MGPTDERSAPGSGSVARAARVTALVQRYAALVRSVVSRVSGRRDDDLADEVQQRVAEALWRQLTDDKAIEHPASYVYRCAVRETVRELRRELAKGGDVLEDAAPAPSAGDPERAARAAQLRLATESCLSKLPPERAQAARAHMAGLAVEEIMELHAWPYQKARNLVARGMADLRALLKEQGHDGG